MEGYWKKRKLLIMSMLNMNNFPCGLRLDLRKLLIPKCRIVEEPKTKRKKWIVERREGYAKDNAKRIILRAEKKMEKWRAVVVRSRILDQMKRLKKNLKKDLKKN